MIKEFVNEDVMNMINAGNIIEAVSRINCNADTDDNIFKAITSKLEKEIHNKKAELVYQTDRLVDDAKTHEELIKKLKEKNYDEIATIRAYFGITEKKHHPSNR